MLQPHTCEWAVRTRISSRKSRTCTSSQGQEAIAQREQRLILGFVREIWLRCATKENGTDFTFHSVTRQQPNVNAQDHHLWRFSSARRHRRELCRRSWTTSASAVRTGTVTVSSERRAGRESRAQRLTWSLTSRSTTQPSHSRAQPGDRTDGRSRLHTRLKPPVKTEDWNLDVGWTKQREPRRRSLPK